MYCRTKAWILITILLSVIAQTGDLHAHPTFFKGARSFVFENEEDKNLALVHYSFSPRVSIGLRELRLRQIDENNFSLGTYTGLLLHRINHELFQANFYVWGGLGGHHYRQDNGYAGYGGTQFDIENQRLFWMASYEADVFQKAKNYYRLALMPGLAPYAAEFEELAAWLMIKYEYIPGQKEEHHVTPHLRLLYRNFILEAGSSIRGEWMLNFMFHF